mmetsp:Transcript_5741/g.8330  ORF Transcript_5741/g.8330 Transcript_5741/m.8330 type:complete len:222 (-) Transcript_5741:80-745(-)
MIRVFLIITSFRQNNPLITHKQTALLEAVVNSRKTNVPVRTVASRLNFICSIKGSGLELLWKFLKVSLNQAALVINSLLSTILIADINLVLVNRYTGDVGASKLLNVAHRTTDTTSDIKNFRSWFDIGPQSKIMFSAVDRFLKCFPLQAGCKVKGLSPSPFIKISHQIIKAVYHSGVFLLPVLNTVICARSTNLVSGTGKQSFIASDGCFDATASQYTVRV